MKKLASLLLALVMIMSCFSAMATSVEDANKGSITVENPVAGTEYTAYKIFDVTYNGTAYAYSISTSNVWYETVAAYAATENSGLKLTVSASDSTLYIVETTSAFSAPAFALALQTKLKATNMEGGIPLTGDKPSVSNLPLGYYFVTSNTGALCNLTTTDPSATIYDKNDIPFNKVDDDESVEVGQDVNYTVTGKVPSTTGFTTYTYEINDTMSAGLDFNKDINVYIDGTEITENFTVDYNVENGYKLTIDVMKYQDKVGKEIKVTYSAKVNETAVTKVEKNTITLTYSNNPVTGTTTTTEEIIQTVYTAKIVVDKHVTGSTATKLAGAKFVLYKMDGDTKSYYFYNENAEGGEDVEWKTLTDAELQTALNSNPQTVTEKVTDDQGACEFIGLEDGTYYLLETEAPAGYNMLKEPVTVVVDGKDAVAANATQEQIAAALTETYQVANNTGTELPETGGMGTTILYVGGGILVLAAIVLLIAKRRTAA